MTITLSTVAKVNCVSLIASVPTIDRGRFSALRDSLEPVLRSERVPFFVHEPQTSGELLVVLDELASNAAAGLTPVLHFLMHGDEQKGLICADKSIVEWGDVLGKLRYINIATGNNLVVISSACYSLKLLKKITITQPAPFYILIAPEKEARMDFVENQTCLFYLDIFRGVDIITSFEENLKPIFTIFHSEVTLFIAMTRYFRDSCIGRPAIDRMESLISQGRQMGAIPDRQTMRRQRKLAKAMIKPNRHALDRQVSIFLLGRKVSFNYRDLERLARAARDTAHAETLAELKASKYSKRT